MNYDFTALDVQWTEMLDYLLFSGEDLVFVRAHFVCAFFFFFYLMFVLNLYIFRSGSFIWLLFIYLLSSVFALRLTDDNVCGNKR